MSADRMDPTPTKARIEAAMQQLEAPTVMIVKAVGGEIGRRRSWKYIGLLVRERGRSGPTWGADAATWFSSDSASAAADGAAFSILLVTRLRDDGLLTRCKRGEAYPGCFDDARRAIASRAAAARQDLAEPLPRCTANREDQ